MDWSLLKPHAAHFMLRDELIYTDYKPVRLSSSIGIMVLIPPLQLYYFAIVSYCISINPIVLNYAGFQRPPQVHLDSLHSPRKTK
jgi:hypothetical protein